MCASLLEARQYGVAEADALTFELGFLALQLLCQVASGAPVSDHTALEYIDGPVNPERDEGVQLFRLTNAVERRIAGFTPQEECDTVERWSEKLKEYGQGGYEPSTLAEALAKLTSFARRGGSSRRAIFLKVLFR
jgi:hypothetical protein